MNVGSFIAERRHLARFEMAKMVALPIIFTTSE